MKYLLIGALVLIAAALVFAWAPPALPQEFGVGMAGRAHVQAPACAPRQTMLDTLERQYAERVKGRGVESRGTLVERLESAGGDTWTLIATDRYGMACIVAGGTAWREFQDPEV